MTRKDYKQYGWVEVSGQSSTLLTATVAGAGLAGGRGGREHDRGLGEVLRREGGDQPRPRHGRAGGHQELLLQGQRHAPRAEHELEINNR